MERIKAILQLNAVGDENITCTQSLKQEQLTEQGYKTRNQSCTWFYKITMPSNVSGS